jgi:hypothetical protein
LGPKPTFLDKHLHYASLRFLAGRLPASALTFFEFTIEPAAPAAKERNRLRNPSHNNPTVWQSTYNCSVRMKPPTMAANTSNTCASAKRASPIQSIRVKRERSDDEEETRRVAQRTNEVEEDSDEAAAGANSEMDELLLKGLLSNDEDALFETLKKIDKLLYDKDEEKAQNEAENDFFHLGGHTLVAKVMNTHLECLEIQRLGVRVLANACCDKACVQKFITRAGGMEAILAAMRRHKNDANLILNAIIALHNLTMLEENAVLFVTKTNGVSLVLDCIKTFSDKGGIVSEACDLLESLCEYEQLRNKLDKAKVGTSLMAAYDNNEDNEEIRKLAKGAITLLFK